MYPACRCFKFQPDVTDSNPFSSKFQIDDDDNISEKETTHKRNDGTMSRRTFIHKSNGYYDADARHPHHDSVPVILLDVLARLLKGHVS